MRIAKQNVICYLFLLFPLSLSSQDAGNRSLVLDSLVNNAQPDSVKAQKSERGFKKIISKVLNFSDLDTLYISPNRYNYALMTSYISNYEFYSVSSTHDASQQRLVFMPNPRHKTGFYFGWRWIFLGWSFDIDDMTHKTGKRRRGTEFDLSLYSSKIGLDVFYQRTGNNYNIQKISGFSEKITPGYSADFNGLKVNIKGLNLYYIFNNRRFSYPAAFSQSTNQRRNAGSMIGGFSISTHNLDFDYAQLPLIIQQEMHAEMKVNRIKYTNVSLNFGYGYNWVFARNCLASLSLSPAITYRKSSIDLKEVPENNWTDKFGIDFIVRAGVVYNNSKYYVGSSFLGRTYQYYRNNFSLNNGFGTLQVYAGFNFYLKKEYRKKK